jgi:hypothetical protein
MPTFNRISGLVEEQIAKVEAKHQNGVKVCDRTDLIVMYIQVLFLVGGLGSNIFLMKYLQSRIKNGVVVKQPGAGYFSLRSADFENSRYTAIMRGAVMSELGLKVSEHIMRRHYGIQTNIPFKEGEHPQDLKILKVNGLYYCSRVFKWLTQMVDHSINTANLPGSTSPLWEVLYTPSYSPFQREGVARGSQDAC